MQHIFVLFIYALTYNIWLWANRGFVIVCYGRGIVMYYITLILMCFSFVLFQLFNRGHGNLASAAYGKFMFAEYIYMWIFVIWVG